MTEDQFKAADKLRRERNEIERELDVWTKELTSPSKLGYLQGWNNNHATKLETRIPREIFDGFRAAAINSLKVRLAEIEAEFAAV